MLTSTNVQIVAALITEAYNACLMQQSAPMVLCGVTATLQIRSRHNELTLRCGMVIRSIILWDRDEQAISDAAIAHTMDDLYHAAALTARVMGYDQAA